MENRSKPTYIPGDDISLSVNAENKFTVRHRFTRKNSKYTATGDTTIVFDTLQDAIDALNEKVTAGDHLDLPEDSSVVEGWEPEY